MERLQGLRFIQRRTDSEHHHQPPDPLHPLAELSSNITVRALEGDAQSQ